MSKNPLNMLLPAGVLAYAASPKVRESVRGAMVKGMASVLDVVDKAGAATEGLRAGLTDIVAEAEKVRQEAKAPTVRVEVEPADEAPTAEPSPA